MSTVKVVKWRVGLQKISMTGVLRRHLDLGLAEAHQAVHDVLAGKSVSFATRDAASAERLASALEQVGAETEVTQ